MEIQKITNQQRRDFNAILVCQHCKHTQELKRGYDDDYYHREVIPKIKCEKCGEVAPEDYRPMGTKYGADQIV